jgi:hypothetical protein
MTGRKKAAIVASATRVLWGGRTPEEHSGKLFANLRLSDLNGKRVEIIMWLSPRRVCPLLFWLKAAIVMSFSH